MPKTGNVEVHTATLFCSTTIKSRSCVPQVRYRYPINENRHARRVWPIGSPNLAVKREKTERVEARVIYNNPYIIGQRAMVESGLALSALTRCCARPHLILEKNIRLPELLMLSIAVVKNG